MGTCKPGLRFYNTHALRAKEKNLNPNRRRDYKSWWGDEDKKSL